MKLIYKFAMVAAAVAALTLVSCGDKNKGGKEEEEYAPLEKPVNTAVAAKVVLSESVTLTSGRKLKSLEFTETSRAIITEEIPSVAGIIAQGYAAPGDSQTKVTVKTYTFSAGTYHIPGFGDVKLKSASVTIVEEGKTEADAVEKAAEVTKTAETSGQPQVNNSLYRAWKIVETTIEANGPKVEVEMTFKHGDLDKIAAWLKDQGVKIPEEIKGYNVKTVQFTKAGSFIVEFTQAPTFSGDFSLVGEKFSYDLQVEGNSIINAHADGTVKVDDPKCYVKIVGEVKNGSEKWTTGLYLTLVDADAN